MLFLSSSFTCFSLKSPFLLATPQASFSLLGINPGEVEQTQAHPVRLGGMFPGFKLAVHPLEHLRALLRGPAPDPLFVPLLVALMSFGHVSELRYEAPFVRAPVLCYELLSEVNLNDVRIRVNLHALPYVVMGNRVAGLSVFCVVIDVHPGPLYLFVVCRNAEEEVSRPACRPFRIRFSGNREASGRKCR